ncbi:MAG: methyl-accepting chemotaxis protein [Treponema sp.]|jgi:methyl-accepting chemotaxis protein|nr:methyl-accepting chemotaxis protein [Treponema sp.]
MIGRNVKTITKAAISVAFFFLPLVIMIFLFSSNFIASIQKDQNELKGIEVLRPAISLMQIVPQYVRLSIDAASGDLGYSRQYATDLLFELEEKYERYFGKEAIIVSPDYLIENWNQISGSRTRDQVLSAYAQFVQDLCRLMVHVENISGLVTDSDLENAYLIAAIVQDLPQAQERIITICNIFRTMENGELVQSQRNEIDRYLGILTFSDLPRIQNRLSPLSFEDLLRECYGTITLFSEDLKNIISTPDSVVQLATVSNTANNAHNALFQLQYNSLDRLQTLIEDRIQSQERRFNQLLVLILVANALALAVMVIMLLNIRRSTDNAERVFKALLNNDLSVGMDDLSRDEIGELMLWLDAFIEKIRQAFISFNESASMVSDAVYDLSTSAQEISATANEQSASVAEIVSTMENNKELSAQVATKTSAVADMAARTGELSLQGAAIRDVNEKMMLDIRDQNAKIIDEIKNLVDTLSRVDESVQLIDTIADQTKLIAFNAALEASSSGEAGMRFAVVASEIRRFADNVVESLLEIKEKIAELQNASQILISGANEGAESIKSGYNSMVEQKKVFENIVEVSQDVAASSSQISALSRQQELASAQIFIALKEISAGVNQFVIATASTSTTVDSLNKMSVELKNTLAKYQTKKRSTV